VAFETPRLSALPNPHISFLVAAISVMAKAVPLVIFGLIAQQHPVKINLAVGMRSSRWGEPSIHQVEPTAPSAARPRPSRPCWERRDSVLAF